MHIKSKLKAEDSFTKRLSEVVDSYITLNTDEISFTIDMGQKQKIGEDKKVNVSKGIKKINDLFTEGLISNSDYINPNNKNTQCNVNAEIEIYKDSDFVYCHKIKASSLSCISTDYINEYLYGNSNSYIIDTCVWE